MKIILKNGRVVVNGAEVQTDVLIEDEKVVALGKFTENVDRIIDCKDKIIMPGVVDAHCHIKLDTGIFKTPDDWRIGSREAALGGITSVIDFVGPMPGESLKLALNNRLKEASLSAIDYSFHMTVLDANPQTLAEVEMCRSWGLTSLKLYTTYRPNYYLDDASILKILQVASKNDLVSLIHCENDAIVTAEGAKHEAENLWSSYPERRPAIAEEEAAARMIMLAQYADAKLVIAHNSSAKTAHLAAKARHLGQQVFNETAPQYLFLNSGDNHNSDEAWRYILQPPLRDASHNSELQKALIKDEISFVITDHCAYTRKQKIEGVEGGTPGGLPGLETLLALTMAVPGMTWAHCAELLSENPCKVYGLWGRKGAILPGFDADIVILKDETYTLDEKQLQGFAGFSPFNGKTARGRVETVLRRGVVIVENGVFQDSAYEKGAFIKV